jgi:predicted transcriptional regulator
LLTLINTMKQSLKPVKLQSALRMPLNRILGTETNVRVLRAIYDLNVPVGTSELARHIKMDKAGVWRAINALEELGAVEAVGFGQQQTLQARKEYPLTRPLTDLFQAERLRFDKVVAKLSEVAHSLVPPAKSIWIEGPVATESDKPNDPLAIGILGPSSEVGKLAEMLRRKTTHIQKQFSVAIEVRPLTNADLTVMESEARLLDSTILLAGIPPTATGKAVSSREDFHPRISRHQHYDDQSLKMAQVISDRLRRDRTLVKRALAFLKRRLATASPREAKELQEWRRILQTYSIAQLRRLLTDPGERGARLRQSSPFTPILSAGERADLLYQLAQLEHEMKNDL